MTLVKKQTTPVRLLFVLGTRPEIIKLAPVIHAAQQRADSISLEIFHTGQHYDHMLDRVFFQELSIPSPRFYCNAGNKIYGAQINLMLTALAESIGAYHPDVVLAEGDTTTVCAAALACAKTHVPFAHQEAGLRSHQIAMLEEKHRIIADALATHWYAPTHACAQNLQQEGIRGDIVVCGNSIVDVVLQYAPRIQNAIFHKYNIMQNEYFLLTAHRRETVAAYATLKKFVNLLEQTTKFFPDFPIIFPLHPHTRSQLAKYGLTIPASVHVIEPVGFFEMLALEKNARLIITDSGGIQEEAVVLQRPCLTIRSETERQETLCGGMNIIVGLESDTLIQEIKEILNNRPITWSNPFGDGTTGIQIISDLISHYAHTHDN